MLPAAEDQTDAVGGCDQRANSGIETTPESLPGMNRQVGSVESFVTVGDGARAAQIGKASASQIRLTRTGAQRSVLVLASSIVVAFLAAANAPSPLHERAMRRRGTRAR